MNNTPLISICIAAYNVEKYIIDCLNSIKKYENIINKEIIIVNDFSIDNTSYYINKWIKENPNEKVIFIEHKNNLGQVKSLINTVNKSSGEYLTFIDSDDFFVSSTLNNKLEFFKKNFELKVIYGNGIFYENGKFYGEIHKNIIPILKKGVNYTKKYINSHTPLLSLSTMLIKKDFFLSIGGFDESGKSNDWITNIKIFNNIKNNSEYLIDETKAFAYRMHNNNISKNPEFQLELLLHVINNHCDNKYLKINKANAYFITALRYLLISEYKKGYKNIKKSSNARFSIVKILLFIILFVFPKKTIKKLDFIFYKIKSFILKYIQ